MPTRTIRSDHDSAASGSQDTAPLTPEERTRLLAEIEAEFAEAERSIREEGVVTADELERHMDALLQELAEEEEREKRPVKR